VVKNTSIKELQTPLVKKSLEIGKSPIFPLLEGISFRQLTNEAAKFWDVTSCENFRTSGTSAASLLESSCLLHESRTNIIVRMDLRSLVELAHDSAGRVNMAPSAAHAAPRRRRSRARRARSTSSTTRSTSSTTCCDAQQTGVKLGSDCSVYARQAMLVLGAGGARACPCARAREPRARVPGARGRVPVCARKGAGGTGARARAREQGGTRVRGTRPCARSHTTVTCSVCENNQSPREFIWDVWLQALQAC
jgi:hypothetical protein